MHKGPNAQRPLVGKHVKDLRLKLSPQDLEFLSQVHILIAHAPEC